MKILQWAGTYEGFESYVRLIQSSQKAYEAFIENRLKARDNDDDGDDPFEGLAPAEEVQVVGSTGIIQIKGGLQSEESWWTRLFGICTYEGIRSRISELCENQEVKDIVLYLDTPGGMVDGLAACGKFITDVDKSIKPIYAHTAGQTCSAGYWLASQARKFYSDEGTHIGSIGVLAIVTEITEYLKREGINKTIYRSAPYKALNNPYEKASDKSREVMNEDIARSHNKFVEAVAKGRKLEVSFVSTNIATGRVFDEVKAMALKMVDGVQSIEVLVGRLNSKRSDRFGSGISTIPSNSANSGQGNNSEVDMSKKTGRKGPVALPKEALAALALGATTPEVVASAEEVETPETTEKDTMQAGEETPDATPQAEAEPDPAAEPTPPETNAETAPAAADAGVVALLQSQLSAAQKEAQTAQAELAVARRELETAQDVQAALETPVRACIERLSIALGATVIGLESAKGTTLVEHFNALNANFEKRFVVGQQSRPDAATVKPSDGANSNVSPINRRFVSATGLR